MPEIITPVNKIKVQLKEWITGRDEQDIQRPITSVKLQIGVKGATAGEIDVGKAMEESKNIAVEKVVISVDGKTDNLLNAILDMHKQDYQFVMSEIDKVVSGDFIQPVSEKASAGIK